MRGVLAVATPSVALLVGCTGGNSDQPSPDASDRPTPNVTEGPVCPWAGGDAFQGAPTFIVPTGPNVHGKITVLTHTTSNRPTVVHAKVTSLSEPRSPVKSLRRSRIVLVSQVFETVGKAHGAPPPIDPDQVLKPANVIASSAVVRTTDLKDHLLTLHVPTGLSSRDYFIVGVQVFTGLCTPRSTGSTQSVVGLVRVRPSK